MKWPKSWEVNKAGVYILQRTDDSQLCFDENVNEEYRIFHGWNDGDTVYIILDKDGYNIDIQSLDSECRFFGPIPDCA